MNTPIKFSKVGPDGWIDAENITLETSKLIEGIPKGRDHIYYQNDETQVTSGIWRSSPYTEWYLSLIHISEPTRPERISYAVFCLKKKKKKIIK